MTTTDPLSALAIQVAELKGEVLNELGNLRRQLDAVRGLPTQIESLRGVQADHGRRLDEVEKAQESTRLWKRGGDLPLLLLSLLMLVTVIVVNVLPHFN